MIAPLRSITTVPWGANLASRREKPVGERRIFFYLDVNDRNILIKKEKTVYKKKTWPRSCKKKGHASHAAWPTASTKNNQKTIK